MSPSLRSPVQRTRGENERVDYVVADLSTVREVRRTAAEIKQRLERVNTLVNNAGGTFPKQQNQTEA